MVIFTIATTTFSLSITAGKEIVIFLEKNYNLITSRYEVHFDIGEIEFTKRLQRIFQKAYIAFNSESTHYQDNSKMNPSHHFTIELITLIFNSSS